jgi:hypothetical protein
MSKAHRFTLGGAPLPLDLHTVWNDEDGQVLSAGDGPILFDFTYRSIRFVGRSEEVGDRARLRLVGDVGPMPFSAESRAARQGLLRIVEVANSSLGAATFRVALGRIVLGTEGEVPAPLTATTLVSLVVAFLVPASSYLDLIATYIRPPLVPAKRGESAVHPEWRNQPVSGRRAR